MNVATFVNRRPLSVLGIIIGLRGVLYGYTFAVASPIAQNAYLWDILREAHIDPMVYGLAMIVMSLAFAVAFLLDSDRFIRYSGYTSSLAYMLVAAAYLTDVELLGAVNQGFIWVALTGFLTYAYLNREYVVRNYQFKE